MSLSFMPVSAATLKKRTEFLAAARGAKAATPGLVLQARKRPEAEAGPYRTGFTATRKIGGAVARNRAKRRLRAVAAELMPECGRMGYDYVLIGRADTANRKYDALREDLKRALNRVHRTPETESRKK